MSLEPFRPQLQVPDTEAFLKLQYRYATLDNVQIQLCEPPPGNTPQRKFLEERGECVFHLGFTVPACDHGERDGMEGGWNC